MPSRTIPPADFSPGFCFLPLGPFGNLQSYLRRSIPADLKTSILFSGWSAQLPGQKVAVAGMMPKDISEQLSPQGSTVPGFGPPPSSLCSPAPCGHGALLPVMLMVKAALSLQQSCFEYKKQVLLSHCLLPPPMQGIGSASVSLRAVPAPFCSWLQAGDLVSGSVMSLGHPLFLNTCHCWTRAHCEVRSLCLIPGTS